MKHCPAAFVVVALILFALFTQCRSRHQSISGTIETDEVHVASRYGGRVEKINAQEGDALKKDDVIVEMEASELKARRDLAAAQLEEFERGPRPDEIEAAKRDWESLKEQLAFARSDAKRAEELLKQKT